MLNGEQVATRGLALLSPIGEIVEWQMSGEERKQELVVIDRSPMQDCDKCKTGYGLELGCLG